MKKIYAPAKAENWTEGPFEWKDSVVVNGVVFSMGGFVGKDGLVVCHFGDDETYYPAEGLPPKPEDRALISSAHDLYWQLLEADQVICSLCKLLNPQHANCTSCEDREELLRVLVNARGERV